MRIYWFWPYVHADQLVLPAAVPRPGDHLLLHTMRDRIEPAAMATLPIELAPTLATPTDRPENSARWALSRASTYVRRVAQRRSILRNGNFDICHVVFSNYFVDGIDFRALARRAALVWEVHDVVPHESRLPRRVEDRFLSFLYRAPGTIVARHALVAEGLVERFGVERDRVVVVPWHVPVVPGIDRSAVTEPRTVLFFGTMRRNKGVDVLLRSIRDLGTRESLKFVFAGRGFPDVEEQIRAAACDDPRIDFEPGYVTPVRKHQLYSAADLVVLPYTEFASASAVLCDAYAYHLPVVVTDVGALGASVRSDRTGWVVPPGDSVALATAIAAAVSDADAWRAASDHARRAASERTPQQVAATLRALYDDVTR